MCSGLGCDLDFRGKWAAALKHLDYFLLSCRSVFSAGSGLGFKQSNALVSKDLCSKLMKCGLPFTGF